MYSQSTRLPCLKMDIKHSKRWDYKVKELCDQFGPTWFSVRQEGEGCKGNYQLYWDLKLKLKAAFPMNQTVSNQINANQTGHFGFKPIQILPLV
jgi:hypothetical protein